MITLLLSILLILMPAAAQTQVDLASQAKRADFGNFTQTKPMKRGTQVPATCSVGEMFFLVGATAGNNVYACWQDNSWAILGGLPPQSGQFGKFLTSDGVGVNWSALAGDLQGPLTASRVTGLQNRAVGDQAPVDGQVLVWNDTEQKWLPQALPVAAGTVLVKNQGVTVASRPVQNFIPGFGLLQIIGDTGAEINIQPSIDSAVVETRLGLQAGVSLRCASTATIGTAFTCNMNPTLNAYPEGGIIYWKPDLAASGSVTLNIDTLGVKPVLLADGFTPPMDGDISADTVYPLWYDGVAFRLLAAPDGPIRSTTASPPVCNDARRGLLWHQRGATGVKDVVVVCAKDASDSYDWRPLY